MRRLKAKTKVKATTIVDLQYAYDCAIAARIITEAEKRERRKNREYDDTADSAVYGCSMGVVEYVDQKSASTATNAIIEPKSFHPHYHHHFG